MIDYPEV